MKSVIFSLLFCTFCIYQSFSLPLVEDPPPELKSLAACLAEQKLDLLSTFGVSSWQDWEWDFNYVQLRKTLDENKRNIFLACLLYSKPSEGVPPVIIKTKEGTYEIDPYRQSGGERRDDRFNRCIEYKHDLYKTAGCWYDIVLSPTAQAQIIARHERRRQEELEEEALYH